MSYETDPVPLRKIHIDIADSVLIFEGMDGTAISWNPRGLLQQLLTEAPPSPEETETDPDPLETLAGRLKSKPKEGLPDKTGNPTAWARAAMHQDGQNGAQIFSTTFHGPAREIALGLPLEAQIRIQGYVHPAPAEGKLPTLSVVRFINYPGKAIIR
jgi:hypothetical protein